MGIKVLVVDDAPFIREVVRQILTAAGFEIVGEAEDGEAAVTLAHSTQPDLILMDLVMPKLSGIEATKEILKKNPNQKIIACSTLDQDTMVMRAIDAGCIHYITKPFKKEELVEVLRSSMSRTQKSEKHL
jgi:two-component system, chemotaxis family, chemotaxis protein CheY